MGYAVIGTDSFTRIAPADKSIYDGNLGSYNVSWTRANGKGGANQGIKFEPAAKNFKNGASDVFTVVVSGFNANATIQVEASSGKARAVFNFLLGQTMCAPGALLVRPTTSPFGELWTYFDPSWTDLVSWLLGRTRLRLHWNFQEVVNVWRARPQNYRTRSEATG
jgi:hypothetical protein